MLIASRRLQLQTGKQQVEVLVSFFLPEQTGEGMWRCRYEICWPDGVWSHAAQGVDSVQAMSLALQMVGAELYSSDYHKLGALFFESPGKGYGFPVPKSLRDLLVGDDAVFG